MVKPPKTMQPEAHDLSKAGRGGGKSFQADSFHQYMARKIDRQRQQFGLVLPPAPPLAEFVAEDASMPHYENRLNRSPSLVSSPTRSSLKRKRNEPKVQEGPEEQRHPDSTSKSPSNSVRFQGIPPYSKEKTPATGSFSAMLKRLKRKHGKGRHRKARKRRRKAVLQNNDEEDDENGDDDVNREKDDLKEKEEASQQLHKDMLGHIEEDDAATFQSISDDAQVQYTQQQSSPAAATPSLNQMASPSFRKERPDLFFLGVVVKVNGYTDPDNETLKRMLQKHGGDLETYETTRVTHIIAEHLSTAKANMYKKQRSPRPVVSPCWIADSIQAQHLLPYGKYLLDEVKDMDHPVGIHTLFSSNKNKKASHTSTSSRLTEAWNQSNCDDEEDCRERGTPNMNGTPAQEQQQQQQIHTPQESSLNILPNTPATATNTENRDFSSPRKDHAGLSQKHMILHHSQSSSTKHCNRHDMDHDTTPTGSPWLLGTQPYGDAIASSQFTGDDRLSALFHTPSHGNDDDKDDDQTTLTERSLMDASNIAVRNDHNDESPHAKKGSDHQSHGKTDSKLINGKIRTVGTDPHFLDSFFGHSRLSFIGSYKQRAKARPNIVAAKMLSSDSISRFVFHVDMDSFFASVVLRHFPQYKDHPVAISHHGKTASSSGSPSRIDNDPKNDRKQPSKGSSSECATCNYKAREYGIKKGMYLGRARELCPDLVVLNYDFDGYKEVSDQFMEIIGRVAAKHSGTIEAVSCDEAYMSLQLETSETSESGEEMAKRIAEQIRTDIFSATQCTASIGIALNKFMAKLGTDKAKPNGYFLVTDSRKLLESLTLRELHGIGWRSEPKLREVGLTTVQDVWDLLENGEAVLSKVLGPAVGKKIYRFCQGEDDREVKPTERKTIGAECSYGVRFDGPYGIDHFMMGLAKEVQKRMEEVGVKGRQLTLKVKQRKQGAKPPPKFLGHGSCHNFSKTTPGTLSRATCDATAMVELGMTLFKELRIEVDDVRGMGLTMSKLTTEIEETKSEEAPRNGVLTGWLSKAAGQGRAKASAKNSSHDDEEDRACNSVEADDDGVGQADDNSIETDVVVLTSHPATPIEIPPLSQLRMSQVASLPDEFKAQIYGRLNHPEKSTGDRDSIQSAVPQVRQQTGPLSEEYHDSPLGNPRRRQTDLRRMMRLAAVQAGNTDTDVSLTQLDQLPLAIKLQVVNSDDAPLGVMSQAGGRASLKANTKPSMSTRATRNVNRNNNVASRHNTESKAVQLEALPRSHGGSSGAQIPKKKEKPKRRPEHVVEKLPAMQYPSLSFLEGPEDLYQEDILPLKLFLDENPPSQPAACSQVLQFLLTVLKEERSQDLNAIICSIRKREDEWHSHKVLFEILTMLNKEHLKTRGTKLDIGWLLAMDTS